MATLHVTPSGAGALDGTSLANAWTPALRLAASPAAGDKVYWYAGAYSGGGTDYVFANSGTDSLPSSDLGCNTAPGDLDSYDLYSDVLPMPTITFTTGRFRVSGANLILRRFKIQGAAVSASQGQVRLEATAANVRIEMFRVENTAANLNGVAFATVTSSTRCRITRSYIKSHALANIFNNGGSGTVIQDNELQGGLVGIATSTLVPIILNNIIRGTASHGISAAAFSTTGVVADNLFHLCGGDGYNASAVGTAGTLVRNNMFVRNVGTDFNHTGTSSSLFVLWGNAFYRPSGTTYTSGVALDAIQASTVLASDPYPNYATNDFTIPGGHEALSCGQPTRFEARTFRSFMTPGPVKGSVDSASISDVAEAFALIAGSSGDPPPTKEEIALEVSDQLDVDGVRLKPIQHTGAGIDQCDHVDTADEVLDTPNLSVPQPIDANWVQTQGVTVPAPSPGGYPKVDKVMDSGVLTAASFASFASGATTTTGTLTGYPVGINILNCPIKFVTGALAEHSTVVTAWNTTTGAVTFSPALPTAPTAGDTITKGAPQPTIDSITSVTGSVGSVIGNVGGNLVGDVQGNVVGSVDSVTETVAATLVPTGLDAITPTAPTGPATTYPQMNIQLWRRFFKKAVKNATHIKTYADNGTSEITTQTASVAGDIETQGAATQGAP